MGDLSHAYRAGEVLDFYDEMDGTDPDSNVVDLLADLMHFCDQSSWDFNQALETARMHFEAECEEEAEAK